MIQWIGRISIIHHHTLSSNLVSKRRSVIPGSSHCVASSVSKNAATATALHCIDSDFASILTIALGEIMKGFESESPKEMSL